jgi:hypothetical protein
LRDFTDGVRDIDLSLDDIDFRRTATFVGAWSRVVLASTSTSAPSLTGQETQRSIVGTSGQGSGRTGTVDPSLVGQSTDITRVVRVGPGSIGSGSVSRSTELRDRKGRLVLSTIQIAVHRSTYISHGPCTRPETSNSGVTRQRDRDYNVGPDQRAALDSSSEYVKRTFDVSILAETKLVPTLQHSASVVEPMGFLLSHLDDKVTVGGGDLTRVVPLEISGRPV